MEIWDLYDRNGNKTGETWIRGRALPPERYHLVVHVWIQRPDGKYLIQQRSEQTESRQGMWAMTGGSATSGDSSFTALQREMEEELGWAPDYSHKPEIVKNYLYKVSLLHIYKIYLDLPLEHLSPGPEVSDLRYASEADIRNMIQQREFWPLEEDYLEAVFRHKKEE